MYAESPPPPALAGVLVCRWTRRTAPDGGSVDVLPDGCIDLVARHDGHVFVAGPDTAPAPTELPGGSRHAGLRFRPGAAPAVLGVPASELRDRRPALADLPARGVGDLAGHVADAGSDARRLAVLEGWLLRRLCDAAAPDPLVAAGVAMLGADPRMPVRALGAEIGLGERQLRRRFHAAVGYGPKTLARVLRLRRLLSLAAAGPRADLARLAIDAGYADQAHMTVECGRLTGRPPSMLLQDRFVKDRPAAAA